MVGNFVVPHLLNETSSSSSIENNLESLKKSKRNLNIEIPSIITSSSNYKKNKKPSRGEKLPIKVLELGCGRGGDIRKWDAHPLTIDM